MTRTITRYHFPQSLKLLDLYLKQKGHDTALLSSDRHALDSLLKATKLRIQFPKEGDPCYNALRRLHHELFPNVPMKKAPSRPRRVHGIGLTGPASDCRTVPREEWAEIAREYERAGAFYSGQSITRH